MPISFGSRLESAFAAFGQLCVGIDPHAALLDDWGLAQSAASLETFSLKVIEASHNRVGIIKPQVSFFERFGSQGFAALEKISLAARDAGLLVIMDAKRGDIGTTMDGYYEAWLARSAPFYSDALTVSPYLGVDSLAEVMSRCSEDGKGLFVLSATSNPEGATVQKSISAGTTLAAQVFNKVSAINAVTAAAGSTLGNFGVVVGATLQLNAFGLNELDHAANGIKTPLLVPGFGAQGANLADAGILFGNAVSQVIASVSRSVLSAGSTGLSVAIESAKLELSSATKGVR